jgi:deoxyribose-phosphate aldolase
MSRARRRGRGGGLLEEARELLATREAAPHSTAVPPWLGRGAARHPGIGRFLDHTLLAPGAQSDQIAALCDEAVRWELKAVCVNGGWVGRAVELLAGSPVLVTTVAGFPLGASASAAKAAEARIAVDQGAAEVDMVLPLGPAKAAEWSYVEADVRAVVEAAGKATVKVILETAALAPVEIAAGCLAAVRAGAAFVMTSTGFHPAGGATLEAVGLMRRVVGPAFGVKASGGVRTPDAALALLLAGANRIGTSAASAMAGLLGRDAAPLGLLLESHLAREPRATAR